ncbi:hypothetical protein Tsubulata_040834 [Turnera subulata]|uniref:CCHC-type domain-containing protein n=1 Tax=Turnera subulata TaxID=218843 RepID=A0A9Q0FV17_9ROSI|nr:hypothetical protein Tsubulata_040834 [Turnera subulata]
MSCPNIPNGTAATPANPDPNNPPLDDGRNTKKARLKGSDGTMAQHVDVSMTEVPMSYKEKLTVGRSIGEEEDPWAFEDEAEVEEDDIVVEEGEDGDNIILSDAFKKRLQKPWENVVIVKLLGRKIGYRALQSKIHTMWKPSGPIKIIDLENNFYIVRFWDSSDYIHALTGGPWAIYEHALCVQPWDQAFRADTSSVSRVVVWMESQTRAKFAKVVATEDLSRPLKGKVTLEGESFKVVYEGLPHICFSCGRYGHSSLGCNFVNPSKEGPVETSPQNLADLGAPVSSKDSAPRQAQTSTVDPSVGAWMVVTKRTRRPLRKQSESPAPPTSQATSSLPGSRFHALDIEPTSSPTTLPSMLNSGPQRLNIVNGITEKTQVPKEGIMDMEIPFSTANATNAPTVEQPMEVRNDNVLGHQGAGKKKFLRHCREFCRINNPEVLITHGGDSFLFTAVYGSPQEHWRKYLWRNLVEIASFVNGPWLVAGDFNAVLEGSERRNQIGHSGQANHLFVDCIQKTGLLDLGFFGCRYTWRGGSRKAKLDRFGCNSEWRLLFPEASVLYLPRIGSDHCPVLLRSGSPLLLLTPGRSVIWQLGSFTRLSCNMEAPLLEQSVGVVSDNLLKCSVRGMITSEGG